MKVLELFAGTASLSNAASRRGHVTFTSDYDPSFNTDYCVDVMEFDTSKVPFAPDFVWASPPCETFSVASIGKHWNRDNTPKTEEAEQGVGRVERTIDLIASLRPRYWIIENPRGKLRKMLFMQGFTRHTVTYCQYGDTRMKPTDLWTNIPDLKLKPVCKNGSPCHVAAPRGSRTGTQGIKGYKDRSRVPNELCASIIEQVENLLKEPTNAN